MIVKFEEIKFQATKTGKCQCGQRVKRSKTFTQTMNPWNRNKEGLLKNRDEIIEELEVEAIKWKEKPVICTRCLDIEYSTFVC